MVNALVVFYGKREKRWRRDILGRQNILYVQIIVFAPSEKKREITEDFVFFRFLSKEYALRKEREEPRDMSHAGLAPQDQLRNLRYSIVRADNPPSRYPC